MSLNQFTDLTYKPWMKIAANVVNAASSAMVSSATGKIQLQLPSTVATPVGGAQLAHPVTQSVSFPSDIPTIQYNEVSYFSVVNAQCPIVNGTAPVILNNLGSALNGINYTSFDGTNFTVGITGYYKIDFAASIFFPTGTTCESFVLQVVRPGFAVIISNTISNPTNGLSTMSRSFVIANSGILKLTAGNQIGLGSVCVTTATGTLSSISFNVVLLDSVSA